MSLQEPTFPEPLRDPLEEMAHRRADRRSVRIAIGCLLAGTMFAAVDPGFDTASKDAARAEISQSKPLQVSRLPDCTTLPTVQRVQRASQAYSPNRFRVAEDAGCSIPLKQADGVETVAYINPGDDLQLHCDAGGYLVRVSAIVDISPVAVGYITIDPNVRDALLSPESNFQPCPQPLPKAINYRDP